jgi:hypothetical protein
MAEAGDTDPATLARRLNLIIPIEGQDKLFALEQRMGLRIVR